MKSFISVLIAVLVFASCKKKNEEVYPTAKYTYTSTKVPYTVTYWDRSEMKTETVTQKVYTVSRPYSAESHTKNNTIGVTLSNYLKGDSVTFTWEYEGKTAFSKSKAFADATSGNTLNARANYHALK